MGKLYHYFPMEVLIAAAVFAVISVAAALTKRKENRSPFGIMAGGFALLFSMFIRTLEHNIRWDLIFIDGLILLSASGIVLSLRKRRPDRIDRLIAMSLVQKAQIETLLKVVEEIGKRNGMLDVAGISIREVFQKKKDELLNQLLLQESAKNSATVSFLKQLMDESRQSDQE